MRKYSIIFTDEAKNDFIDIWIDISEKSQCRETATSVTQKLEKNCNKLDILPYRGKVCDHIQCGLRCLISDNYLIFYGIEGDKVFIRNIFHGSRDYTTLF